MTGIIDTHAHLDDPWFLPRIDRVLEELRGKGVAAIITSGSDVASSERSAALAERFGLVYASVGVYPNEVDAAPADWLASIRALAGRERVVAVGEIGLDYGFSPSHDKKRQRAFLCAQLELAAELSLPVVLHDRDADEDLLSILREYRPAGTIHRIASPPRYAEKFLELGLHLGIGPQITYEDDGRNIRAFVRDMPLAQLLLETDAPFLPPACLAGQKADPSMIAWAAEGISRVRGDASPQEIVDIAAANSRRLFRLI
ncbi:MAG: TatD family hydrolase [Oscillospiraceae bacterium]|nr:TatD family hydrolase [Oscillospiraceae bacterium]